MVCGGKGNEPCQEVRAATVQESGRRAPYSTLLPRRKRGSRMDGGGSVKPGRSGCPRTASMDGWVGGVGIRHIGSVSRYASRPLRGSREEKGVVEVVGLEDDG